MRLSNGWSGSRQCARGGGWVISDDRDVYLIQPVDGGLAKIGVADNPQERLHTIQLMCPVQLQLIDVIRGGGHMLEHGLHTRFAEDRSRSEEHTSELQS